MKQTHVLIIPLRLRKKAKGKAQLEMCLITGRHSRQWMLPRGWREAHTKDAKQAQIEAYEEAGLKGRVILAKSKVVVKCSKYSRERCCKVYLMRVKQEFKRWPEQHQRQRTWVRLASNKQLKAHLRSKSLLRLVQGVLKLNADA